MHYSNSEKFLEVAIDPQAWFRKSKELKQNGDVLWDKFEKSLSEWEDKIKNHPQEPAVIDLDETFSYSNISQFLYGLALETIFKAYIIKFSPDDIEFNLKSDGVGRIYEIEVKQLGINLNKGHDLISLAKKAGAFNRDNDPIFENESEYNSLKIVLKQLTEVVVWKARYPIPNRSTFQKTPTALSESTWGDKLRKSIDPVLDHYYKIFDKTTS